MRWLSNSGMGSFLQGHVEAFRFFGGVPRRLLYDNLKSVVLERRGDAIHFNPTALELAAHYHFEPRPVGVRRGNEKGRVERTIRFLRTSFWPARSFKDLDDLNAQALDWCRDIAGKRPCPEDVTMNRLEAMDAERLKLLPLPDDDFPAHDRLEVRVLRCTPRALARCTEAGTGQPPQTHRRPGTRLAFLPQGSRRLPSPTSTRPA